MFDERKHPRDTDGKFTDGNGGNDRADKLATAVKKYSDTPKEDLESMGIGKPSLTDFITRVKNGKTKPGETFELGEITDRARKDIERLTGQKLNATKHVISADSVRHIDKRHGESGVADHSMSTLKDFNEIAEVLQHYDRVEYALKQNGEIEKSSKFKNSENNPAPHILYTKKDGKTMYVVEALSDTKRGALNIVSAYKTKSEKE